MFPEVNVYGDGDEASNGAPVTTEQFIAAYGAQLEEFFEMTAHEAAEWAAVVVTGDLVAARTAFCRAILDLEPGDAYTVLDGETWAGLREIAEPLRETRHVPITKVLPLLVAYGLPEPYVRNRRRSIAEKWKRVRAEYPATRPSERACR